MSNIFKECLVLQNFNKYSVLFPLNLFYVNTIIKFVFIWEIVLIIYLD